MPKSLHVLTMRDTISPRLAIKILSNGGLVLVEEEEEEEDENANDCNRDGNDTADDAFVLDDRDNLL